MSLNKNTIQLATTVQKSVDDKFGHFSLTHPQHIRNADTFVLIRRLAAQELKKKMWFHHATGAMTCNHVMNHRAVQNDTQL